MKPRGSDPWHLSKPTLTHMLGAMKKSAIRPRIEILHLSTVSEGRQLELNTVLSNMSHALAKIVADDADESLWVEINVGDQPVQIPLELVREAVHLAEAHVHSETWYETHDSSESGESDAAHALGKRESRHGA